MKRIVSLLLLVMSFPFNLFADPVEVGSDAPQAAALTDEGHSVELASLYAKGPVLVYFYPKADTPGCTAQACNLRDHFTELTEKGVIVAGVSRDNVEAQAAFKEKYHLPFTLFADTDNTIGKAFGVGSYAGLAYKRQSFLVRDGKVVWRDLSATPAEQAQDVLRFLGEAE